MTSFSWRYSTLSSLSSMRWSELFYNSPSSSSPSVQNSDSVQPSPPILVSDSAQMALENCIARVKLVIQQVKWEMQNEHVSKLNCPITLDFPQDPVVTNCGHIFDRAGIEQLKNSKRPCALCKTPLTQLTPIHALKDFIEDRLPDPVLTCSNFTSSNKALAVQCFEMAKNRVDEKDYEGALGFLAQALRYTNSSEDYAAVPKLYDQLGAPEKALLSRLFLSLYQLQEGKIQEAIETLQHSESKGINASHVILALTLKSDPSPETVKLAMASALKQENVIDKIFIYKEIIAHLPDHLEAYKQVIPFIKDRAEKKALLLQAVDLARNAGQIDLEADFRAQAESSVAFISKKEWADAKTINLPPYPQELKDFLDGDCTIWPGKKRSETHIVVPLFSEVALSDNEALIPFTLESLDRLDKSCAGPGYRFLWDQIPKDIPAKKEFRYAVMTSDVIPGSRNKTYEDQLKLLPQGYKPPGVFDAARAILWENQRSGNRRFNDNPTTYTNCEEIIQGYRLIVGGFASSGLDVSFPPLRLLRLHGDIGVAGWREFKRS